MYNRKVTNLLILNQSTQKPINTDMEKKNIIIGAGLSGLSCGWVLKDKCIILEKQPCIGGLAATKELPGFKFDLGGHRLFTCNPSIVEFVRDLLPGEILEAYRKSKIYKDGKFIYYPLRVSVVFQLNPLEIALSFFSYIYRKIKPLKEFSFEERAINNFGDYLYKLFFRDYTKKVWGISCENISKELVDIRLQRVSLMRVIKHAFIKDGNVKSFTDRLLYPKDGIGKISESLSKGLDIRLNDEVTSLICSNGRIEKAIVNNSEEFDCKNIVSTMPITKLIDFFNAPVDIKKAAGDLKYRSLICAFLTLNRENYTNNHWIYLPGKHISGRLHEPKNWSPNMAPENKTGICAEIFCSKDDDIWKMTDTEIAHQVVRELPLLEKFEIENHFVTRVEYAYPVYDINYRKNIGKVKSYLSSYKNLFLLGRSGSFRYINMDTCLEEGLKLGHFITEQENSSLLNSE